MVIRLFGHVSEWSSGQRSSSVVVQDQRSHQCMGHKSQQFNGSLAACLPSLCLLKHVSVIIVETVYPSVGCI